MKFVWRGSISIWLAHIQFRVAFWFCPFRELERVTSRSVSNNFQPNFCQIHLLYLYICSLSLSISHNFSVNPDFLVRFNGKSITKNGKTYLKPENTKLSFTLTRMILHLGNLYNGDKALGDNTNLFLNENWQDVWPEIKKSVYSAFSQIIENVLGNVFQKVPFDELFQN